jgi:acyl carrier protein
MAKDDLERQLRAILVSVVDDDVPVGIEDNLFQLGVLDSVLLIRLVGELEKTFNISVTDREMVPDYFLSLHRLSLYVEGKLSQSAAVLARES